MVQVLIVVVAVCIVEGDKPMTLLYGYNEAENRMKNDTMNHTKMVALDHDFYTNNHKAVARKNKEVHNAMKKHTGDDVGYFGKNVRNKFAMGGAVKERRGFFE